MKIRMNKKGTNIILVMFELMAVVMVVYIAIEVGAKAATEKSIVKTMASNDLAMMVNVLIATPGDVIVQYPRDLSELKVALLPSSVVVYEEDFRTDASAVQNPVILPDGYALSGIVEHESKVCLIKDKHFISVEGCPII